MRLFDQDDSEELHMLLVVAGFALLLVAAFCLYLGSSRSQWPIAIAQVLTVEVRCEMEAAGYSRAARRAPPVVIACDQVDRFRADNPNRSWIMSRRYSGQVRITRDGDAVTLVMGIGQAGNTPRVGDTFEVAQNPDMPGDVTFPERGMMETMAGFGVGGLGLFVLAAAFFLV